MCQTVHSLFDIVFWRSIYCPQYKWSDAQWQVVQPRVLCTPMVFFILACIYLCTHKHIADTLLNIIGNSANIYRTFVIYSGNVVYCSISDIWIMRGLQSGIYRISDEQFHPFFSHSTGEPRKKYSAYLSSKTRRNAFSPQIK